MGNIQFEKVDGIDRKKALQAERADIPVKTSQKEDETPRRVYIGFGEGVSIQDGINLVESRVLDGKSLVISRFDKKGNAIVTEIPGRLIDKVKGLREVACVKVESPAVLL